MNEEPKPRRRWIPIVLGVLVLLGVLAIGGIVFTVAFFRQNMTMTPMSAETADREFAEVRARFPGQQPLVEMVDRRPQYVPERAAGAASSVPLKTMHIIAWDDDEGQLVTFSLPFWLLRLKSGPIQLSAYSQGWDDRGVSFSVEDLEKHGPGLLLDLSEAREGRVMIWVE
jgi:hypothetical protein